MYMYTSTYADLKTDVSIGDSMICSDIWNKYHQWYLKKLLYVISRAVRQLKF